MGWALSTDPGAPPKLKAAPLRGVARDVGLRLQGTAPLPAVAPPGAVTLLGGNGCPCTRTHPPCAPCRRPALSPLQFWLPSLKGQQAQGQQGPRAPGRPGGGRAPTLLLPQVLGVLAHPQLRLHARLRLVQDVLGQSTESRPENTLGSRPNTHCPPLELARGAPPTQRDACLLCTSTALRAGASQRTEDRGPRMERVSGRTAGLRCHE